jgi:polysaccharide biosynthesis transport protein
MNDTTDAAAIFAPLWKRKWLILVVGILVAGATYIYYKHKPSVYGASTALYLGGSSEVQSLLGASTSSSTTTLELANQAELINSNVVGEAVQRQLLAERDLVAARGTAIAAASSSSDFISITTKASTGEAAAHLANTYAQVYLQLREANYRRQVQVALASSRHQLESIERSHRASTSHTLQAQDLIERINQLNSSLSIGNGGDRQVNPAVASSVPLSPDPKRNAIFGFVLGIALAAIAAYVLSRFDRRLRSLADIEAIFRAPVLTAVPSIRRPIIRSDGRPVPTQALREPLRRLHTTLQLRGTSDGIDVRSAPCSVLFISADAGDGKSTLIAGLALVQGEAGARVAIVESDLRRPTQADLLGVDGSPGLTEALAGMLTVQQAMQRIERIESTRVEMEAGSLDYGEGVATATQQRQTGSVTLLPSGGTVANPPALLAGQAMPTLLRSIAENFNFVLIDAPPPLEVSDVLPLLAVVDAIVIVARVGHTSETSAQRLVDFLSRVPHAPVVGTVANDASRADMEAFGFSSTYYEKRGRRS